MCEAERPKWEVTWRGGEADERGLLHRWVPLDVRCDVQESRRPVRPAEAEERKEKEGKQETVVEKAFWSRLRPAQHLYRSQRAIKCFEEQCGCSCAQERLRTVQKREKKERREEKWSTERTGSNLPPFRTLSDRSKRISVRPKGCSVRTNR